MKRRKIRRISKDLFSGGKMLRRRSIRRRLMERMPRKDFNGGKSDE